MNQTASLPESDADFLRWLAEYLPIISERLRLLLEKIPVPYEGPEWTCGHRHLTRGEAVECLKKASP